MIYWYLPNSHTISYLFIISWIWNVQSGFLRVISSLILNPVAVNARVSENMKFSISTAANTPRLNLTWLFPTDISRLLVINHFHFDQYFIYSIISLRYLWHHNPLKITIAIKPLHCVTLYLITHEKMCFVVVIVYIAKTQTDSDKVYSTKHIYKYHIRFTWVS